MNAPTKPVRRRRALDRVELERQLAAERAKYDTDTSPEESTRVIANIRFLRASLASLK